MFDPHTDPGQRVRPFEDRSTFYDKTLGLALYHLQDTVRIYNIVSIIFFFPSYLSVSELKRCHELLTMS